MTDTFDWAGLWDWAFRAYLDRQTDHPEARKAAAAYLRTRIEAAFVPVARAEAAEARVAELTAQLAEARESERAAVVAWLKSMVTGYPESSAYGHAAFLIEAGEHLK